MKLLIALCTALTLCFAGPCVYAKAAKPKTVIKKQTNKLNFYSRPSTKSKIINQLDLSQYLIPIYRKGEWLKVGNPDNGDTGWINLTERHKLLMAYYKPKIKTIFINTESIKPGKYEITAYENGKQVDAKRAAKLFKEMQKQQKEMDKQMLKLQLQMDKLFNYSMPLFNNFPLIQPLVLIVKQSDGKK